MAPDYLGTEQFTEEDRAYKGSRFSAVRDALFANPYQSVWGDEGEPPLPVCDALQPSHRNDPSTSTRISGCKVR